MDESIGRRNSDGSYIWLRHTMQVNSGKRVHTLHVEIPVPLGVSADVRERLIREAEAGIEQLADHIEGQTTQMPQAQAQPQPQRTQPQPSQSTVPPARPAKPAMTTTTPAAPAGRTAMAASPGTISSGAVARETPQASTPASTPEAVPEEAVMPPSRPNIGASMPGTLGEVGGSLTLPQFLHFLKELGLDARQAMDYLKVKTLSGLNYREALDQIQQIILREQSGQMASAQAQTQTAQKPRDVGSSSTPNTSSTGAGRQENRPVPPSTTTQTETNRSVRSTPNPGRSPAPTMPPKPSSRVQANTTASVPQGVEELKNAVLREAPPTYFDEEVDFEDAGDSGDFISELTDMERETAQEILAKLQEAHGSSIASEARLRVLHNVVNDQVPDDRLEELIQGVWGVTSLRKLKDEQLEALISWAKTTDDFIADVDMVLTLLQEEEYAGSDR